MATSIGNLAMVISVSGGKALSSTLEAGAKATKGLGSAIGGLKGMFAGLAVAAAGVALTKLVTGQMEQIDVTTKQARALGMSTLALSRLQYAADFSGVSSEQLGTALKKMSVALGGITDDGGPAATTLRTLGLDAAKLKTMSPDEQFATIGQALAGVQDPGARAAAAVRIFGKAGVDLLPFLMSGQEEIKRLGDEAEQTGNAFTDLDAAKVEQANDAMARIGKLASGIGNTLAIELAPYITEVSNRLFEWWNAAGGIDLIRNAVESVTRGIAIAADYVSLLKAGLDLLQAGAAYVFGRMLGDIDLLGSGFVKLLNLLPGVEIEWTSTFAEMSKGMMEEAEKQLGEAGQAWDDFASGKNEKNVRRFFDGVNKSANDAAANLAKPPATNTIDVEALEEQMKKMEQVGQTIDSLKTKLGQWGMSEAEKTAQTLRGLGATEEQIAEATRLQTTLEALDGIGNIDAGSALDTYAAKMERLNDLWMQGTITAEQYDKARADAKKALDSSLDADAKSVIESIKTPAEKYQEQLDHLQTLLDSGRLTQEQFDRAAAKAGEGLDKPDKASTDVGAIEAGSSAAAAMIAASFNGSGADGIPKSQLAEAKTTNKLLAKVAKNTGADEEVYGGL